MTVRLMGDVRTSVFSYCNWVPSSVFNTAESIRCCRESTSVLSCPTLYSYDQWMNYYPTLTATGLSVHAVNCFIFSPVAIWFVFLVCAPRPAFYHLAGATLLHDDLLDVFERAEIGNLNILSSCPRHVVAAKHQRPSSVGSHRPSGSPRQRQFGLYTHVHVLKCRRLPVWKALGKSNLAELVIMP